MEYKHYSVMLHEAVGLLEVKKGGVYVDCTLGGGGHTGEILKLLGDSGKVIAIDLDPAAIENAKLKFSGKSNLILAHSSFERFSEILDEHYIDVVDGVIIDLGVSSYQIDTPGRGFSYMQDAALDMRMDSTQQKTAYEVVNNYSESELSRILFEYGEERHARKIVGAIIAERQKKPIETTTELVKIISECVPKFEGGGHPAKRSFQAIRIEVNNELGQIEPTLRNITDRLKPGGIITVISFHSLEDRIVKTTFTTLATGCTCPKGFPICICGNKPKLEIITKKPMLPSETECEENPRSHSAKLRAARRI